MERSYHLVTQTTLVFVSNGLEHKNFWREHLCGAFALGFVVFCFRLVSLSSGFCLAKFEFWLLGEPAFGT